jgi:hypothetical protein
MSEVTEEENRPHAGRPKGQPGATTQLTVALIT